MRKYASTPRISIEVVTKGPVATAASKSRRFRISGTKVPTVADRVMDRGGRHGDELELFQAVTNAPQMARVARVASVLPWNDPSSVTTS